MELDLGHERGDLLESSSIMDHMIIQMMIACTITGPIASS